MRRLHLLASLAALAIFSAGASERASAQADVGTGYTSKPIRFVVGYAAHTRGGVTVKRFPRRERGP